MTKNEIPAIGTVMLFNGAARVRVVSLPVGEGKHAHVGVRMIDPYKGAAKGTTHVAMLRHLAPMEERPDTSAKDVQKNAAAVKKAPIVMDAPKKAPIALDDAPARPVGRWNAAKDVTIPAHKRADGTRAKERTVPHGYPCLVACYVTEKNGTKTSAEPTRYVSNLFAFIVDPHNREHVRLGDDESPEPAKGLVRVYFTDDSWDDVEPARIWAPETGEQLDAFAAEMKAHLIALREERKAARKAAREAKREKRAA